MRNIKEWGIKDTRNGCWIETGFHTQGEAIRFLRALYSGVDRVRVAAVA